MSVRAMWKGVVRLGEEAVPVKMYAAIEADRPSFRLLHADDLEPVRQELFDPETDKVVERDEVRKGLERDGRIALLSDEDLASLEPEKSRDIELFRFVPTAALDDRWYDRPYWLGPDDDEAGYASLVAALEESGAVGIARWAMRNHRYQGALRVRDGHLILVTLRHPEEVVPLDIVGSPKGREPTEAEAKMAGQLVDALKGPFDPAAFPETYADRVRALVEARADGQPDPEAPVASEREPAGDDLTDVLQQSLARVKEADRG